MVIVILKYPWWVMVIIRKQDHNTEKPLISETTLVLRSQCHAGGLSGLEWTHTENGMVNKTNWRVVSNDRSWSILGVVPNSHCHENFCLWTITVKACKVRKVRTLQASSWLKQAMDRQNHETAVNLAVVQPNVLLIEKTWFLKVFEGNPSWLIDNAFFILLGAQASFETWVISKFKRRSKAASGLVSCRCPAHPWPSWIRWLIW